MPPEARSSSNYGPTLRSTSCKTQRTSSISRQTKEWPRFLERTKSVDSEWPNSCQNTCIRTSKIIVPFLESAELKPICHCYSQATSRPRWRFLSTHRLTTTQKRLKSKSTLTDIVQLDCILFS